MNLESQIDLLDIAKQTEGRNGADLRAICMEAGMFAIRDERSQVSGEDFVRALHKVSSGFNRQTLKNTFGEMFA
jgi:proteasome regulatory subunit